MRTIYFDIEISEHNYRDYYISTLLGCVLIGLLCSIVTAGFYIHPTISHPDKWMESKHYLVPENAKKSMKMGNFLKNFHFVGAIFGLVGC